VTSLTRSSTDVTTTDPVLAEHVAAIRQLGKRVVADVVEIGRRLSECKCICGHGNWLPWLEREFGWTEKTAENLINVYRLSGKFENFSNLDLPLSGLYLLAAPSTPAAARGAIVERAQVGEPITVAEIKQTIKDGKLLEQALAGTAAAPPTSASTAVTEAGAITVPTTIMETTMIAKPVTEVGTPTVVPPATSRRRSRKQRRKFLCVQVEGVAKRSVEVAPDIAERLCSIFSGLDDHDALFMARVLRRQLEEAAASTHERDLEDAEAAGGQGGGINLTDTADEIAAKLITLDDSDADLDKQRYAELPGEEKLRKIGALIARHFKDRPCSRCDGSGTYQRVARDFCHIKNPRTYKSPPIPCPVCCPVEYAETSGVTLRKEGCYAEAAAAAIEVWDDWALAETLVQWGAEPQEIKAALRQLNCDIKIKRINALRKSAAAYPPNERYPGLAGHPGDAALHKRAARARKAEMAALDRTDDLGADAAPRRAAHQALNSQENSQGDLERGGADPEATTGAASTTALATDLGEACR
jgi:Protein of unknown function (DUF3102)